VGGWASGGGGEAGRAEAAEEGWAAALAAAEGEGPAVVEEEVWAAVLAAAGEAAKEAAGEAGRAEAAEAATAGCSRLGRSPRRMGN